MAGGEEGAERRVVGGVDTHKDLHVAAVVDEQDRVVGTRCFATTRPGYRQMLAWMRSFGDVHRVGIESTGSYGAGLLRFMQQAGIDVLEVTAPDRFDRRRRGKNDDLDAQNAAHAAFAGRRTVTPRSRDGMVESLRVLNACRKTAVAARRIALQMIQNTIVCAPDNLRDVLRTMTRMQLVRTLAAWRPDLTGYRDVEGQRSLQGRGHPSARAVTVVRRRRVRDIGMGRLVQQSPAAGADWQHPAGRGRGALLRHAGPTSHGSVTQAKQPPANPARFTSDRFGASAHQLAQTDEPAERPTVTNFRS